MELLQFAMLPVRLNHIGAFISRRSLANEFKDMDNTTLSKMGIVQPWWMKYYGAATNSHNRGDFADLGNLYFAQSLKHQGRLPCDISLAQMRTRQEAIWNSAEGRSMMNTMRQLTLEKMAGGRPSPLQDWAYYLSPENAKRFSIALATLLTSPQMVAQLSRADHATSAQVMSMASSVLYTLNAQFLPTQTQAASADTSQSVDEKLQAAQAGIPTANGVTLSILQAMQRGVGVHMATTVQFRSTISTASLNQVANLTITTALNSGDSELVDVVHLLMAGGSSIGGAISKLTHSARTCMVEGCSVSRWASIVTREEPARWDSSTRLLSVKRLGQYMAMGSFFMDLAPVFEGHHMSPEESLDTAHEAIEALAGSKDLIKDTARYLGEEAASLGHALEDTVNEGVLQDAEGPILRDALQPAFDRLGAIFIRSNAARYIGSTVEEMGSSLTSGMSAALDDAESVAGALGCITSAVSLVEDVQNAVRDFQTGNTIGGVAQVVSAVGAGIALAAGVLALVGLEIPFLAPLAIGVALVGFIISLFVPPPPPPPTGPQQICTNLQSQGFSFPPAPPPPSPPHELCWSDLAHDIPVC